MLGLRSVGVVVAMAAVIGGCGRVEPTTVLLRPPTTLVGDAGPVGRDGGPSGPDATVPDAGPMPRADAGPAGKSDGELCITATECTGNSCFRSQTWRGGYCTTTPCTTDRQCSAGYCINHPAVPEAFCAGLCPDAGCRSGYDCTDIGGGRRACLPQDGQPPPPPPGNFEDGEACTQDSQCAGRTCLTGPTWPGGHCTTLDCQDLGRCADHLGANNECLPDIRDIGTDSWCARLCRGPTDCRSGYACVIAQPGVGLCLPETLAVPPFSSNQALALNAQCDLRSQNGRLGVDFNVAATTSNYMVTAFTRDGSYIQPVRIEGPGPTIDFRGTNQFQDTMSLGHGSISSVLISQVPQLQSQVVAGAHHYTFDTQSQDVCWYLLEETTPGRTIDINVYLVGTPGLRSANAAQHTNLQSVLTVLAERFQPAGLSLGTLRYFDANAQDTARFSVLRSDTEFIALMTRSTPPGPTKDDILSLNLFFVRSMMYADGSPLGIASALAGPAGLHGSRASGVVASSEYFGIEGTTPDGQELNGNEFTGLIIGHEIGHYLGLFHTSEVGGRSHDPLLDTPECRPRQFPESCPDLGNLMFPLADPANINLTQAQTATLRANPLSKD